MTEPNPYTRRAREHWEKYLPEEYEQIPPQDRDQFFLQLGEQIEDAIVQRTREREDQQEPSTTIGYQKRFALLSTLRQEVEREVLDEMLPAPPDLEE